MEIPEFKSSKKLKGPEHKQERRKWLKVNKKINIPTVCLEKKCQKEFLRKSVGYCKRCPECQQKITDVKTMPKLKKKALAHERENWGIHRKKYRVVLQELTDLLKIEQPVQHKQKPKPKSKSIKKKRID